nr:hypothetical protein [Tanacetum cinerariifolium]
MGLHLYWFLEIVEMERDEDPVVSWVGEHMMWDVDAATGRYLSIDFIVSDTQGGLDDMLIEKRTRHVGLYPVVIIAMSVKLYNNRLYLSSTSSTLIVDDDGVTLTKEILSSDNTTRKAKTLENLFMGARNWKYDGSNLDRKDRRFSVDYLVISSKESCPSNLDRKDRRFSVDYLVIRYMLELEISDETAEVVVVIFDETERVLLKCSVSSIDLTLPVHIKIRGNHFRNTFIDLRLQDEEASLGLPTALANIVGTRHTLELKSHTYYEHGVNTNNV